MGEAITHQGGAALAQNKKQRLLWGLGLLGTAVFTLLMGWLHYQQLLSTGY